MHWLKWEKHCPVVLFERHPRYGIGRPDVLGITARRYLIEIEIKESLSDFRANKLKPYIANRDNPLLTKELARFPKFFWYLVPAGLVDKILPEVPVWAGLLRGPTEMECKGHIYAVKQAPANTASEKLSAKESVSFARLIGNQLYDTYMRLHNRSEMLMNDINFTPANDYEI